MKHILGAMLFIACSINARSVHAQTVSRSTDSAKRTSPAIMQPIKVKGPKPIKHEWSAGIRLNSNGWSIFGEYGKLKAKNIRQIDMFHSVRFIQIEVTEKFDPREHNQAGVESSSSGSTKYKYGKINNFYAFKAGYGFKKLLAGKPEPGTVSIHWVNALGVALGIEKPYYVNTVGDPDAIKFSESTASRFLNRGVLVGRAGFSKGWGEMKLVPGGHFRSSIHFDFANDKKSVLGADAGVNVEYYGSDIQLMANQKGTPYFLDVFVAIQFGRRW